MSDVLCSCHGHHYFLETLPKLTWSLSRSFQSCAYDSTMRDLSTVWLSDWGRVSGLTSRPEAQLWAAYQQCDIQQLPLPFHCSLQLPSVPWANWSGLALFKLTSLSGFSRFGGTIKTTTLHKQFSRGKEHFQQTLSLRWTLSAIDVAITTTTLL